MKILLVDDDAFLRDMYATKFSEAGCDVSVAAHAEEALQTLEREAHDVVLLDMVMPGMSGVELLQAIAEHDIQVKAIVLSNQGEQSDISAATEAGAIGYIIKAESIPSEVVKKVTALVAEK